MICAETVKMIEFHRLLETRALNDAAEIFQADQMLKSEFRSCRCGHR